MRIISFLFVIAVLVLSLIAWNTASDTRVIGGRIIKAAQRVGALKKEQNALLKFKKQTPLSLDKFYLEVFNDIKEVASYYHAACEIKIIGAKDLVNTREFFKESQYKGIRQVDILCQIDLKDNLDTYLFDTLFKMLMRKPIEILEVRLEKNILNLTMRLYGP